jgi:hypothetical protein
MHVTLLGSNEPAPSELAPVPGTLGENLVIEVDGGHGIAELGERDCAPTNPTPKINYRLPGLGRSSDVLKERNIMLSPRRKIIMGKVPGTTSLEDPPPSVAAEDPYFSCFTRRLAVQPAGSTHIRR